MKSLDRIANLAVIVAVIVFLTLASQHEIGVQIPLHQASQVIVGRRIPIPGLEPSGHQSLVLIMSTTCHFCTDSLPFYKSLSERVAGRLFVVAIFPQSESEARKYLESSGVRVNQVLSLTPDTLGVRGTPTVLLLDQEGRVKNV